MRNGAGNPQQFTLVHLDNWRNFTLVDSKLAGRSFLVGPNAAGKSNLLDAFRFLHDIVAIGGGFQAAVARRGGVSRIRCLAARQYPDICVGVDVGTEKRPASWRYTLKFAQDNQRTPLIRREMIEHDGQMLLDRPDDDDRSDTHRLKQTALEQANVNQKYRELVGFFESIRYLHIVPQLIREPERSTGRENDPYGGDFLHQIALCPEKTRQARLRRIRDALVVAVPQLQGLEMKRDERGTPHLQGKYAHWRPTGAWQNERDFSDGTLRLIGLLWAILDGNGPLLLEEPELSLHCEVVRFLPQVLARIRRRTGRQILISTHSSDLLRDDGIGIDEVTLLRPEKEGTSVKPASDFTDIRALLNGGASLADAVIPKVAPPRMDQLLLPWGD